VSGFVGLWQRDGRPVDAAQLAALTESLRFRGPDGLRTWHRGAVGLGHARFTTHAERDAEPQPLGLDGRYWIAGHIRLDAREELAAALDAPAGTQDAALVLRAYRAWGEACLARVRGDFAFAVWDEAAQRLFCARDPFGVRPFFYADLPGLFLFGNTLDGLRRHPRVSRVLDEHAIADFLACGHPLDAGRSFFRDVRRLPGGHALVVTAAQSRQQRYWALPAEPYLRYRRPGQYVEQFRDLLARAVRDRGGAATAVALSGGLDSGAIAAAALGRLGHAGTGLSGAHCYGMSRVFEDREPRFARISADALGLPLDLVEAPDDVPFRQPRPDGFGPEPCDDFYYAETVRWQGHVARGARVLLDGQGGDEVFQNEWLLDEARRESWPRLLRDALWTWRAVRRPGLGLRARLERTRAPAVPAYLAPGWIRPLGIEDRLADLHRLGRPGPEPRARARARLAQPSWQPYFERHDAGATGIALESRWPYLDHRVLRFALALPPFPWCVDKYLQRRALQPVLPAAITGRPKSPLGGHVLTAFISSHPGWPGAMRGLLECLAPRLDPAAWLRAWDGPRSGPWWTWELARPIALAHWLKGLESGRQAGTLDGEAHGRPQRRAAGPDRQRAEEVREARTH
jgi:asparagine synthase (glutamine-hydrolysing)